MSNHQHAGRMAGILSCCGLQESEQGRFVLTTLGQKYIHAIDILIYAHRIARTQDGNWQLSNNQQREGTY